MVCIVHVPCIMATTRSKKRSQSTPTKDPHGGLTAAGRRAFARKDGSKLRPGVRKSKRAMSAEEMRRKGSWAVRFYGRKGKLPRLRDENGEPTRFALTAHAWGEPVPKTVAEARAIARRGRALLAEARRRKEARPRQRAATRSKKSRARVSR